MRTKAAFKPFFLLLWTLSPLATVLAFQTESGPPGAAPGGERNPIEIIEAGVHNESNVPLSMYYLAEGDYEQALKALTDKDRLTLPWLQGYLNGLIKVSSALERSESAHFVLFTPPGQKFLSDYALPSLEKTADHLEKALGHRPKRKIRVEIYADQNDFSAASTLSVETLERSGAIGICKFHRLMIMSPQFLPLGYRWLDALSHEYVHLIVNEMSASKAELWLHEGTARYFETSYRSNPPQFLTPHQKTELLEAKEESRLISFGRMSPSLVYLKDQSEVSLAFSQVSHAVQMLVQEKGRDRFIAFLRSLRDKPFAEVFRRVYKQTPQEFETEWQERLAREKWDKTQGAMPDEVRFEPIQEESVIGANVQGRIRLGDRMRQRGHHEAALLEYEKALTEEPDNAVILLKAAKTHLLLGQKDLAVQKLRRATDKNPNYGTPHLELAKLVEPKEALPHLLEANAINPFDPSIHERLAQVYEMLGEGEKAKREEEIYQQLR